MHISRGNLYFLCTIVAKKIWSGLNTKTGFYVYKIFYEPGGNFPSQDVKYIYNFIVGTFLCNSIGEFLLLFTWRDCLSAAGLCILIGKQRSVHSFHPFVASFILFSLKPLLTSHIAFLELFAHLCRLR